MSDKKNTAAIFAMYDKEGKIDRNIVSYLREIKKYAEYIVVVADNSICQKELSKIKNIVDFYQFETHGEYDFGSYKRGFFILKNAQILEKVDNLLFFNDSCKYTGKSLKKAVEFCLLAPFSGLTKNQYGYKIIDGKYKFTGKNDHLQSYFFTVKSEIFRTDWFAEFMKSVKAEPCKEAIVYNYEQGLSNLILSKGYDLNSFYSECTDRPQNYYLNNKSKYKGEILLLKKKLPKKWKKRLVSNYFSIKTESEDFKCRLATILSELKDKKVLVYGAGVGFTVFNQRYGLTEKLNLIAIADKKFTEQQNFCDLKAIPPEKIVEEKFDYILVTNEFYSRIVEYLTDDLKIDQNKIRTVFDETIDSEVSSIEYLESFKFSKTLKELKRKLKDKTVVIYGAGSYFEIVKKYYDISDMNIIGVSDRKFAKHEENQECFGYKVYSLAEVKELKPDYVLIATMMYINIIEELDLYFGKGTKIKIRPLLKKDIWTLIKEIWR